MAIASTVLKGMQRLLLRALIAARPDRMPRVKVGPAAPDRKALDVEIARLRDLDVASLRTRWRNVFGRLPPPRLPRHLLFRMLAYRLQADHLGDLDGESRRLLDSAVSPEAVGKKAVNAARLMSEV